METKELTLSASSPAELQKNFGELSKNYLHSRLTNNPEFETQFKKTFGDLIFSQPEDILEKIVKTKPNSLFNAVFVASEIGASFAKKEAHFIPYAIKKKERKNGVETTVDTGEFSALVVIDVNYQKQQILKMENCKKFFTAEIHAGVEVTQDLSTGNFVFEGKNDVTKPTVGYYAVFVTTDDVMYDLFMSNAEIIDKAKFSPQFKADNYKRENGNIHFEKIVVRNLLKQIPKLAKNLINILAIDEYTEYVDVTESAKPDALEQAKMEMATPEVVEEKKPSKEAKSVPDKAIKANEFF